jgi:hypothetical protein
VILLDALDKSLPAITLTFKVELEENFKTANAYGINDSNDRLQDIDQKLQRR